MNVFSDVMNCRVHGIDKNMPSATSDNITIINFGIEESNVQQQSIDPCLYKDENNFIGENLNELKKKKIDIEDDIPED